MVPETTPSDVNLQSLLFPNPASLMARDYSTLQMKDALKFLPGIVYVFYFDVFLGAQSECWMLRKLIRHIAGKQNGRPEERVHCFGGANEAEVVMRE